MELPKNIVQIGKPDPTHKIFVEDYVISYMKQWNKHGKRDTGIVLYGKRMSEGECKYYFVYGASYLPGVEARMQYLTDDEKEEAEDIRRKYFSEYEMIGWGELRGELPEGFYVYENSKGFWVKGYACFFEKNDSMLSFMVSEGARKVETQIPVIQKETTYTSIRENNIDARMEERNRKLEQLRLNQNLQSDKGIQLPVNGMPQPKPWKNAAMVMALVVCVVAGLVLTDEEKRDALKAVVGNTVATAIKEKGQQESNYIEQLQATADTEGSGQAMGMKEEGEGSGASDIELDGEGTQDIVQNTETENTGEAQQGEMQSSPQAESPVPEGDLVLQQEIAESRPPVQEDPVTQVDSGNVTTEQEVVARYVSYTIAPGDTLLSICRNECGSESFLQQVCQLNNIENADDIKIGQIILLPE